jgi:hypothetical protein
VPAFLSSLVVAVVAVGVATVDVVEVKPNLAARAAFFSASAVALVDDGADGAGAAAPGAAAVGEATTGTPNRSALFIKLQMIQRNFGKLSANLRKR